MTKRVRTTKLNPMSSDLRSRCIEVLADRTSVQLSNDQFDALMEKNAWLNNQLVKFNSPSDTMDREDLMSALAVELTGRQWPMNMEGRAVFEKFIRSFFEGARAKGYEILD